MWIYKVMVRVINLEQAFASNQHKDFILKRLRNSSRTLSSLTPNILNVVYFSLKKCPNQNHILFCFLNSPRVASGLFYFFCPPFLSFIYLFIYLFIFLFSKEDYFFRAEIQTRTAAIIGRE